VGWWKDIVLLISYKDVEKLEKFMSGKPVAEQEIGFALCKSGGIPETSMSRRKFYTHFGENSTVKPVKVLIWMTM
jgi:hypothetical protein